LISFIAVADRPQHRERFQASAPLAVPGSLSEMLWQENNPEVSPEIVGHLMANLLISYLFLDLGVRPGIPVLPSFSQYYVASLVSQEATQFVMAHEYGHVLCGHLACYETTWQQEFEADACALEIVIEGQNAYADESDAIRIIQADASLCAPLFFLSIDDLICKVLSDDLIAAFCAATRPEILPHVSTHPRANVRMESIKKRFDEQQRTSTIG